jgi:hypothetical protein
MSMKNSNDTIGNRTRDLPAYSAPTAPPRTPARRREFKRKKVQNGKREKLEEALIKKMQLNANKGTTTDEVKGGAQIVRQLCTQLLRCTCN